MRDYLRGNGQTERTKVEEIIQSTTPIKGTSGQRYLRNRGITASLPECIRFRPKAYDSYGAVTALATDSDGNVLAVHQIYVTADGAKAPLDVIKRTNKLTDGWSKRAAVRCPGAKPLVLAEGIETALSVWQATGRETWACLGIANIGHAPVPEEAEVIVARDGDAADSPATEQLHKAMGNLKRRGVHVRLAEPPRGKDFNDVLVDEGKNAVRDLIASASDVAGDADDLANDHAPGEDTAVQSGVVIDLAKKRALDPARSRANGAESQPNQSQQACNAGKLKAADLLIGLADESGLFHAPDGTAYADLTVHDHRETWPVRSRGFRRWMSRRFYEETSGAPNSDAIQSALNVIEARAHYDGPERRVHVRVAGLNGRIYLDLADKDWRAIEIDEDGWRLEDNPPVRFRRAPGMLPLPVPESGGSISALRPFLNVRTDDDFTLAASFLLAAFPDKGPRPVLAVSGSRDPRRQLSALS